MLASPTATEGDILRIRERLGLDEPLHVQYLTWLANVARLDFGESVRSGVPVGELLPGRVANTLQLTLAAMIITIIVGMAAGVIAAMRPGTWLDTIIMATSVLGLSIPPFWLGLMLILLFSVRLDWFPAGGGSSPAHLVLPAISLGLASSAIVARMVRSSMLEVIGLDYIRTARAKGLSRSTLIVRHALPNALIPTITVIGLQFGALLAGATITETIFAWPGLGSLLVQSILNRDFPVVQAALLLITVMFIVINLLTDVLYAVVDPRISLD
jgi:peptide/nickel transport system permease protein/oligopeptide transport system permease protein